MIGKPQCMIADSAGWQFFFALAKKNVGAYTEQTSNTFQDRQPLHHQLVQSLHIKFDQICNSAVFEFVRPVWVSQ